MSWIPIAIVSALLVSLLAGLMVAAVLGDIAERLSEQDMDFWASLPLTAQRTSSDL
jgi:hypothetical protein